MVVPFNLVLPSLPVYFHVTYYFPYRIRQNDSLVLTFCEDRTFEQSTRRLVLGLFMWIKPVVLAGWQVVPFFAPRELIGNC